MWLFMIYRFFIYWYVLHICYIYIYIYVHICIYVHMILDTRVTYNAFMVRLVRWIVLKWSYFVKKKNKTFYIYIYTYAYMGILRELDDFFNGESCWNGWFAWGIQRLQSIRGAITAVKALSPCSLHRMPNWIRCGPAPVGKSCLTSQRLLVGGLEHEFLFSHILAISSSQLTFIFFRGVEITNHIHRLSIDYP